MDDQVYNKKLESLQRYVPFLGSMINELKAKGNREAQLAKFKSLYEMITDTKKRLKIETLTRCEEVITSIYLKVNPQLKSGKLSLPGSEQFSLCTEGPRSTPQSPSPPRDILLTKPVTIPTEKVVTSTKGDTSLKSKSTYQRPKIEVYSNVMLKPASPSVSKPSLIDAKIPDMSKPPISIDDLKTLEDEVEQKINDAVYQNKSVDELQEVKKQLQLQLKVEEINSYMSERETINTTVRNTPQLSKRRTSISSEEKSKDKKNSSSPIKEIKSPTSKGSKNKAEESKLVKQCNMETDLFGNLLSSIDSKILEEKKVLKKGERRSSCSDSAEVKKEEKKRRRSSKDKKRDREEKDRHHKKDKSRDRSSSSKSHKSHSSRSDKHDNQSSKLDTRPENSITKLLENEMTKTKKADEKVDTDPPPVTYKRLADKYNPKPKPKPTDPVVDKTVTESIEQQMKISPIKTISTTILPLTETTTDVANKPVELPDILHKIIPKPTLTEVIPTVAKQDPRIEHMTPKITDITPTQQLHFEPPRFISPPRVPEPMISPNIVLTNQTNNLMQSQRICPVVTPRMDFDSLPHPEPQINIDHQFNMNRPFLPGDPRQVQPSFVHQTPVGYMGQPYHSQPDVYNRFDPRYYNHQFGEPQGFYPDRAIWNRDRRPGDPRNYREYREMKEKRQAAQNKEVKDPRLAARDPRLSAKDSAEIVQKEAITAKTVPPANDTENSSKNSDKITDSKETPRERVASTKFDKIYSKTNKSGTSKPGTSEDEESFMSPLDSLYNAGEKRRTGRGYGVQSFRIPKKSQREDEKGRDKSGDDDKVKDKTDDEKVKGKTDDEKVKDDDEKINTNKDEKRKPPVISSDSEESDVDHTDDVPVSVEEEVEETPVVENKFTELGFDTSRIKVIIDCKCESDGGWGDSSLKSPTCEDFVSEYDKELMVTLNTDVQSNSAVVETLTPTKTETETDTKTSVEPSVEQTQTSETEITKNEEPQEQSILAHFFENLLKSKNKKDKKTALFSLIETFSDSFDNKEIQKIRKIIKVNEDEEDDVSDDDNKDDRCDTPSVTSHVASKDATSPEEVPVVGSTTGGEQDLTPDLDKPNPIIGDHETQVNEISKSGTDEINLPEAQLADVEEDLRTEAEKPFEPVMVSVGERIKSRKRQTPKPKKKCRTELDHLHADIKDMFIRDGVLTASGKRMCRILKDDPNALIKNEDQPAPPPPATATTEVQPKKERKKPGPKPKPKRPVLDANSIKDMRVVLAKMPDDMMSSSTRTLRTRITKNSYSELDEDEITEPAISSSMIDDDSESDLDESSSEESQIDNTEENTQVEDDVTHKRKKRRKVARWAAGILTKVKKKKPPSRLSNKSPTPEPFEDHDMCDYDVDRLVEPDKDYYIDYTTKQKLHCKLCKYTGMTMTSHYLKEHPQSEVLSSRFAPTIASDAVKDFLENGSYWENIPKTKLSTKYQYCCRMCGYSSTVLPLLFYEHVTTHTGEYRHQCGICEFTAANSKTMASHFITTHPDQERKTIKNNYTSAIIFAYMCGECNFVQLNRKSVEDHANIFHLGEKAAIFKVNMSTILDPLLKDVADKEAEKEKAHQEQKSTLEKIVKKSIEELPVMRKKPGPKSKTLTVKPSAEKEEVRVRKKPGPKSKTQKAAETIEESSRSETPTKELTTRKRKRSLDKLFSEDSGDDLDSIITLSVRSSRAAKEKATAKLKSLMENTESAALSPAKRKLSVSDNSNTEQFEVEEQEKKKTQKSVAEAQKDTDLVQQSKPQRQRPNNVEELIPPMVRNKDAQSNREDENIFTCKNDIMQEETKKIEEERLQKMDELNKSIGSRTSNLDFINKLSSRLTQEKTVVSEEAPIIKSEPVYNEESAPVLESQVPVAPTVRKPVFEEEMVPAQANITFRQDKPNSLFSNMIEKLQGKVNEAATRQEEDHPLDSPTSSLVFSLGELIQVTKCNDEITFSCHVLDCHVKTKDKTVFMLHCKFGHKAMTQTSCLCDKCGVVVDVTPDTTLMENLYDHLLFAHSDLLSEPLSEPLGLKMRRLSGDKLSIKKEESTEEQNPEEKESEEIVNEAPLQLAEDNPFSFKIANVMSLADTEKNIEKPLAVKNVPPLMLIEPTEKQKMPMVVKEAKQSSVEQVRPKKAARAMQKFIETPGDLYKCPHFYCIFSTNVRTLLAAHLKAHKGNTTEMVRCVYCDMKTPWEHVPMHIDIRHANCKFACSHCLYRAISTEYVCMHMELNHFDKEYTVIALQNHKSSKKFAVTEQTDYKSLCPPYQCSCINSISPNGDVEVNKFLFMTEYVQHLIKAHKNALTVCGHDGCCSFVTSLNAANHWEQKHQISVFQCAYCKYGSNDITNLYPHFALNHANLSLDVLVRKNDFSVEEFGYTDKAFEHLQHKKNLPPNLLLTIGKRGQRSIKLIQLSSNASPEFLVSSDTRNSLLKVSNPPKTVVSTSAATVSSSAGIQPNQLILSSPTVLNKLFVTTSTSGLLLLSAPLIKSGQQTVQPITSTAPINKVTVQTSTASATQSKEPVRLGGITLYPGPDPSAIVLSASTSTMVSEPVTLPNTPLLTTPITSIQSSQTPNQGATVPEEDTTSQNTASSEEDILQSAIRSILEEDGSLFSRPQSPAPAEQSTPLTILNDQIPPEKNISTPVEHVDMDNVRLELDAHETLSNFSDDAFISSSSLDPFVEDPLSITPTLNVSLPPVETQEVQDPLDVSASDKEATIHDQNPVLITDMRRSVSNISVSDDESDGSFTEKKKRGLMGYQLFRCFGCSISFSNVKSLKSHLKTSTACKKPGPNSYQCVHCDRWLKTIQRFCDHLMTHGVQRFSCSLCEEKFTIAHHAKLHMKSRHGISAHLTSLVPLKADQIDLDLHEFILKPAQTSPFFKVVKPNGNNAETNSQGDDCTYTPDQINSIPIRQIFSSNVKCGLCNYQTKVRVNIIRHLQMHLDEKAVPDTAPVNPVPCLEKNEKMFDKMINLAASSITTSSRMGGPAIKGDKEKEEERYPEFVPSHRRYVCCALGCSYLCPEEGNLKHHVMALHSDESVFTCAHCQVKMETSEIDTVIKHFKLHGLTLYKCHSCSFIHNLKHKVERHMADSHLDVALTKVVTIRAMDSEPVEEESGPLVIEPSTSKFKPWSCCMCKVKYHTQQEIQSHVSKKHNIDTQYKCTLCSFKNDDEDSCREHFKDKHPTQEFDMVLVYQKLEEEVIKDDIAVFDTTPLWQRDKPRVRHIRGILFEDVEPLPNSGKSPKKKVNPLFHTKSSSAGASPAKTQSSTVAKTTSSVTSTLESCSKNLFDCIDAVARGTVDTSISEPGPSGLLSKKGPTPMGSPRDEESNISKSSFAAPLDAQPPDDDDVILLPTLPNVIVIDSDDSDGETNSFDKLTGVNKIEKEDDIPKTKDKDSKTKPVAKNRTAVKRPGEDLFSDGVKLTKIDKTTDDQSIAKACNRDNLIKLFGSLGTPFNKQWKCPKCNHFKSKMIGDFVFHLYKELNCYRYFCQLCQDKSITYKYMVDHLKLHPNYGEEIVEAFSVDPQLDAWIHMVIREQSLQILEKTPLFRKVSCDTDTIGCYFCQNKFASMTDCCEHMLYHWVMMPYQCQHCRNEFYTVYDLRHHHKVEHPDAKFYPIPKGPTITKALQCIENFKKVHLKKPSKTAIEEPPAKKPRSEGEEQNKSVIVVDDPEEAISISPQAETATVNPDEVFACKVCVFVADTQEQVQKHLLESHRVKKNRLFHVLSKEKADRETVHKYACNMCSEVATELNLRMHFMKSHPGFESDFAPYRYQCSLCDGKFMTISKIRYHFSKNHTGEVFNYKTVVPLQASSDVKQVKYSCPYCSYVSYAVSKSTNLQLAIKSHLKRHLSTIECDLCKTRFRYVREVAKHFNTVHSGEPVKTTVVADVLEEYNKVVKQVTESAIVQEEAVKVNKVARKSTSAKCPKTTSELDMTKIMTTFEMENLEYTTTAEQLMKMFNMNTYVDLSGCWVDVVK